MSTPLRLRAALGPQAGDAVALRFNSAGAPPVIPPGAGLRLVVGCSWRPAAAVAPGAVATPWQAANQLRRVVVVPWQPTTRLGPAFVSAGWATLARLLAPPTRAPWGAAVALLSPPVRVAWQGGHPALVWARLQWHGAVPLAVAVLAGWHGGQPAVHAQRACWRGGHAGQVVLPAPWHGGRPAGAVLLAPWQAGQPLISYGGPWVPYVPPVPPAHVCYLPAVGAAVALRFSGAPPDLAALRFVCLDRRATVRIPILRVYMVINSATLTRVDGGVNIPCFGLSLSLDRDSWAWGFSATLPASSIALIEPTAAGEPVELEAVVNGMAIRLIAESMSRERVFGQVGVRVQGRGKTAVLDAPYSPILTFGNAGAARTHQQLLDAVLPGGWSADYGLTAWLVPAGVWSHQGTSMTAALALAAAGGGYIQPHPTADEIRLLPQYPVAPWGWSGVTPDFELPSAVLTREGIDWAEKPRYNGVYVAGPAAGKAYLVKRAATAGDVLAPMVTELLATHVDAGRQRGLPIVADVGRQARLSLRLPVLPATSIIQPGKFVRYTDGAITRLGLSRSVGVEVTWGDNAALQVWQTIGVETHVL